MGHENRKIEILCRHFRQQRRHSCISWSLNANGDKFNQTFASWCLEYAAISSSSMCVEFSAVVMNSFCYITIYFQESDSEEEDANSQNTTRNNTANSLNTTRTDTANLSSSLLSSSVTEWVPLPFTLWDFENNFLLALVIDTIMDSESTSVYFYIFTFDKIFLYVIKSKNTKC